MSAPRLSEVRAEALSRLHDDTYALIDVNLTLRAGRVTALLGANGAGKSTLMGLLSTALRPSEGRVRFDDADAAMAGPRLRRLIGHVAHRPMLYGELTARENLEFFASLYGVDASQVAPWLERVGLARAADRAVAGFSRGMAQRLALARALVHAPALVLLDEPFTGLDPTGADLLVGLVQEARSRGAVVVLVTHDLALSDALADDVVVLRAGRVAFAGERDAPLDALYRAHAEARGRAA
jgi:heme exporter protein A